VTAVGYLPALGILEDRADPVRTTPESGKAIEERVQSSRE